jgi:hypothetical protein
MSVDKSVNFDKEYCRLLDLCMSRTDYGALTFFVDSHMSEYAMKSCMRGDIVTTNVISDYFNEFEIPDLDQLNLVSDFYDGNDDDCGDD